MYQVYTLSDLRNMGIRYVGMGQNAYKRYATHILNPSKGITEKDIWVKELLDNGIAPVLNIIESVETKQQAEDREHYWIQHYLGLGLPLANISKIKQAYIDPKYRAMNLETAKQIIATQGWSTVEKARRSTGKQYLYAARRSQEPGKKLRWRYIGPLAKLETMTEQEILEKISK